MFRFVVTLLALSVISLCAHGRAQAAPPPIDAYGKLPGIEQISLSPSGQRYAFIAVFGDKRKLVAANLGDKTDKKVLLATDVGDAKVIDVSWAGDDHLLVTISHTVPLGIDFDVSKTELNTVVVLSLSSGKVFVVFDKHPDVGNFVEGRYGVAQVGGHWYGYFGGVTYGDTGGERFLQHMWPDLYRVDLDTGSLQLAARGSEVGDDWLVGPDGQVIARTTYDQVTGTWRVLSGGFAGQVLASGRSKLADVGSLMRGRTADTIVIDRPSEHGSSFQELKLDGGGEVKTPEDADVVSVLPDPVSGLWIGDVSGGDQPTPSFFSPTAEARIRGVLKGFKGHWVALVSYTPNLDRMIVETSGSGDSTTYWLVDMAARRADPIGYERPEIGPDDVGTIEMVDWKAADGLALHGVLSLPPGRDPKNLPLVVMPHGGPEDRDYPVFHWWAQLFASRGYAVFQPNFRGSSGYGVDFRDAGFGQWGRKMQTDVSDGVAVLVKQGIVDPKRACIVGGSYGGYAALAGVTVQQGLYRCSVSLAGVSDLEGMLDYARDRWAGGASLDQRYWKAFMGVTSAWHTELNAISPVKLARQADAPILLIHGKDDTIVPIEQSYEMQRALKDAGKPVELVVLPGADHHLLHEDTRLAAARASLEFVLKYNPPDPEPAAPVKQADAAPPAH